LLNAGEYNSREFWKKIGIRQIISNALQNDREIFDCCRVEKTVNDKAQQYWRTMTSNSMVEWLKALMSECPIIQFRTWTETEEASVFMDRIFTDVIKPLKKRDHEFIFQLGDFVQKHAFEVDEFLDIMHDYSSYGRVTLVLDQNEADRLWNLLHGRNSDPIISGNHLKQSKEKYQFLFNMMSIDVLIIFHGNEASVFAREWQFELKGRELTENNYSDSELIFFNAGYQLGLLLHLDIPHCIVLGLAVSGVSLKGEYLQEAYELFSYISDWMKELSSDSLLKMNVRVFRIDELTITSSGNREKSVNAYLK
jgi:hypothetical protein